MAKRKKRAATSRSSRKKRRPVKSRTTCKTADRPRNVALLQNDEQPGSGGQARNIVRLRSADRLLGVQVPLNADRPGNSLHRPTARSTTKPEEMQGGSPPPEDTIATDEAQ